LVPGGNFCSCPDCSTSEPGTCKHIEFTLAQREKKRDAKAAFARATSPHFPSSLAQPLQIGEQLRGCSLVNPRDNGVGRLG